MADPNVDAARNLWQKLEEAGYKTLMQRFLHLWRLVELAAFVPQLPVTLDGMDLKKKQAPYSVNVCIALGVGERAKDGTVKAIAASSKVRSVLRIKEFYKDSDNWKHLYSNRKEVWNYEKGIKKPPALVEILREDNKLPEHPPVQREKASSSAADPEAVAYGVCAEPAVYEKLHNVSAKGMFLYTVQCKADYGPDKKFLKYAAKIVPRCGNCAVAKPASKYYGDVVTDKSCLENLPVPRLTPPVLRLLRELSHPLTKMSLSHPLTKMTLTARDRRELDQYTLVWLDSFPDRIVLPRTGPFTQPEFNSEVNEAIAFWSRVKRK